MIASTAIRNRFRPMTKPVYPLVLALLAMPSTALPQAPGDRPPVFSGKVVTGSAAGKILPSSALFRDPRGRKRTVVIVTPQTPKQWDSSLIEALREIDAIVGKNTKSDPQAALVQLVPDINNQGAADALRGIANDRNHPISNVVFVLADFDRTIASLGLDRGRASQSVTIVTWVRERIRVKRSIPLGELNPKTASSLVSNVDQILN